MEIVEVKCANCCKTIYLQEDCIREKMFCTLGCMELFTEEPFSKNRTFH